MTKNDYIQSKLDSYFKTLWQQDRVVNIEILNDLLEQWDFDYRMEHGN